MPATAQFQLRAPSGLLAPIRDPGAGALMRRVAHQLTLNTQSHTEWPGGSQAPEDAALRERFRWDLEAYARHCFPDVCTSPFSSMHYDFFHDHVRHKDQRGWHEATAAPRESAKTSIKVKIQLSHDALYRTERYIALASANADLARDKVKEVRDLFDMNAELIRLYGPQQTRHWRQADFVTQTGVRIRAFTPRSKVRGFLWHSLRPTKIVLDDSEDAETVLTPLRRQRFLAWFNADVAHLGTPSTNFEIIGTILHPESFLATILRNPGFQSRVYRAVQQFADGPEAVALWRQWRAMILDLENPNRLLDGRAFYDAHAAAMLTGVQTLWPEHISYYDLMLSRVIYGESAFWQELMNQPLGDERYLFDMENAAYCTVEPGGIIRQDETIIPFLNIPDIAAYWDPTPDKRDATGDYACCVVVGVDRAGYSYVLDAYCAQEASTENQVKAVVALLYKWQVPLLGLEANNFQSLLAANIRDAVAVHAAALGTPWAVDIVPITNNANKIMRIRTLEPLVHNGWLQFSETLPYAYYQQFAEFLPIEGASAHDDGPDATEGALRVVRGLYDRRSAF